MGRTPRVSLGYRRILVPISDNAESQNAVDVACRLAADRRGSITLVAVIEVPPLLPLDAHMKEEEDDARARLRRADATVDSYGLNVCTRLLRAREASSAIVEEAEAAGAEMLVIGAPRRRRASRRAAVFGATVKHVLKRAPCPVMVVAAPEPIAVNGRGPVQTAELAASHP